MMFNHVKPVVISVVIVLSIATNGLVIIVIARYPALRQDRTSLFMLSLCMSDLACGCTSMPISAAVCSSATLNVRLLIGYLPEIQRFFLWWFAFTSLHSLSWVALSKLIAIASPFRYDRLLTRNRCLGIIVLNWVIGAVLAASKFSMAASWNMDICSYRSPTDSGHATMWMLSTVIVTILIPEIALIVATAKMLAVVLQTRIQISAQIQSLGGGALNTGMITVQAIRSAKSILIICFASLTLTVPLLALAVLKHIIGNQNVTSVLSFSALWLYNSNSFMNSFLYLVLYRSIREKTIRLFADMRDALCVG